jgi:two-component system phosphate regulon sensor histidine kinase PhoR
MPSIIKQNLRFKLLIILVTSLFFGLITVGALLYYQFQTFLYNSVKNSLQQNINLAEQSLDKTKIPLNDTTYLKQFVDQTAQILQCRLTIIDINGKVLADSEVPVDQLPLVENHLLRPEIQQALLHSYGTHIRRSFSIPVNY